MKEFLFGTKNYDIDWFLKYGLSYNEAVKTLCEWGFSYFLAQNCFLQMVGSAVVRAITGDASALRFLRRQPVL